MYREMFDFSALRKMVLMKHILVSHKGILIKCDSFSDRMESENDERYSGK